MLRYLVFSFVLLIAFIGNGYSAEQGQGVAIPEPIHTTSNPPNTTTQAPPTNSTTVKPLPPPIPTNSTTVKPSPPPTIPTTSTTTKPTVPPHPTPTPTNSTTPTPSTPSPTPPTPTAGPAPPPPPSDRKFDAFSFLGGFALGLGLVAIGLLSWKFYLSRQENYYHTL